MDELPDWSVPVYQSLTQPQLQGGVPRSFCIIDVTVVAAVVLWWWPIVLIGAALYLAAWIGTHYDPYFFEIIMAHVQQHDRYEG